MSDQFVGEIRVFPFNFAPLGWAMCNGQLLPISQNTALFSLLGTNFGGNGTSNFALPNLQGSFPVHWGQGPGLPLIDLGQVGGSTTETLLVTQIPSHSHTVQAATTGNASSPSNAVFGGGARGKPPAYGPTSGTEVNMSGLAVAKTGGSQPHSNMPPYVTFNFCIALQGIFPARS